MKKSLLGLGTLTAIIAPITFVVACGNKEEEQFKVNFTFDDGRSYDESVIADGGEMSVSNLIDKLEKVKLYSINREHELIATLVKPEDTKDFLESVMKRYGIRPSEEKNQITVSIANLTSLNDASKSLDEILDEVVNVEKKWKKISNENLEGQIYIDFYKGAFLIGGEFIEIGMPSWRRGESLNYLEKIIHDDYTFSKWEKPT